ncbi:MAG: hypothetical protein PWQ93_446 [Clostridiales bacterium]|nr:hypothetical protein [Clostridiales bacterium]
MDIVMQWLGQAGFVLNLADGVKVCIDPYLSHSVESAEGLHRLMPINTMPEQLDCDIIISTHDHLDHFDPDTIIPIYNESDAVFMGPSSCLEHYKALGLSPDRFHVLDRGQQKTLIGLSLKAVAAEHTSGKYSDAIGMVIDDGTYVIYHTGDSEYTEEVVHEVTGLRPDIMFVPINGRWGNMTAQQAAQLVSAVQPKIAVPMHYGMFAENTADPQEFIDACASVGWHGTIILPHML